MIVVHFDTESLSFNIDDALEAVKMLQLRCPCETFIALPDYCNLKKDIDLEYLIQYRDMLNEVIKEKGEN